MQQPSDLVFNPRHLQFIVGGLTMLALLAFFIVGVLAAAPGSQPGEPTPAPTLPPPPQPAYVPVDAAVVSPVIVQRIPRRGEELAVDGLIELIFDRAMNPAATEKAFTLQSAAASPQPISGRFTWADAGRTLRFAPAQPLTQAAVYDVVLTQAAVADDGAPLAEPFTFRFNTPGYLEVTQVVPAADTVDVAANATITVMFNRPVVPLTNLAAAKDLPQPVEFSPAIAGQGEWLNTSIYVFTPADNLPGGVTFTATVAQGLKDVTGKTVLPADFSWQFTTQPPEVVSTTPTDGQTLTPIESPVQVTFSQPVDLASARAKFSLSATSLFGRSVPGQLTLVDSSLTFTPTARLDFDTTYEVAIEAGVTSAAGGVGSTAPYRFRFTTVPLPRIVETYPAAGESMAPSHTDFNIVFNTPINPDTVMPHIEMTPPLPITPTQVYTSYSPWSNTFSFSFGARPSTAYEVRIAPGIEDPYGNPIAESLQVNFRTAPLQPNYQLRVPDMVGTYDAALPAKVVVGLVNVDAVDFKLYRLTPQDITRPQWDWYDATPPVAQLVRQWRAQFEIPDNQQVFRPVDLVEGGGPLEPGLYLLDSTSPRLDPTNTYGRRHLLVVTELNLTLKAGQREAMVWATRLDSGQPRAGLTVTFFDDGGNRLGEAVTDKDGLARLDLGQRTNRATVQAVVLPNSDQPFSAVSENWARGVSPYDFGLEYAYTLPSYTAHLYTDRSIYRPGQTVYFKGILRAEDDVNFRLPDVGKVQVTIRDAAYETIFDQSVTLNPNGAFDGQIVLAEGASLGNYVFSASFGDQYFEQYFQVAAYRPPEFEVTVTPESAEILRGEDVRTTIAAKYFFGGPLAGTALDWNVLAQSYRFSPPQLGNYSFDDADDPYTCFDCWWWYQPPAPEPVMSGNGVTDAAGELPVTLAGAALNDALGKGSYQLTIEGSAIGPDNQAIAGRATVIVHKGDYYIGLSPQEYVADAGKETAVDLVTVDWAGQRQANRKLEVQVVRYEWVNTYVEADGGGYWTTETKKEETDRFTVTTNAQGEAVARFTPPQGGSYQVIAQDAGSPAQAGVRSSIFVWVAGKDDVSWRRENNDRLTLISDKTGYAPGETAEILIPSPFEGEHLALVTVERGRILRREVIKLTGSSTVYRLPLTAADAPNVYVSVVLVQGRNGPNSGDAPRLADYKVGILPLDVTPLAQTFKVTLTPGVEQSQPGQPVTYNLTVTDVDSRPVSAAEFSLDLVDKAVLSLQPRPADAIVQKFYGRRGLGISTSSGLAVSANRYLLELAADMGLEQDAFVAAPQATTTMDRAAEKEMAAGALPPPMAAAPAMEEAMPAEGVAVDGMLANQAEIPAGVDVRTEFSDTAYWNPVIVTDEKGQAEVTVTLPDNLTTWVMRGVGVTGDTQVGEGTVELVATMPLLIRPVAPRFFVVDDRAELAANVTNNTAQAMAVEVSLAADDGVLIDPITPAAQTVTVPANGETKVTWQVVVQDVPQTELVFAAVSSDGQYKDAAKPRLTTGPDGSLRVLRYTAPDTVGTAGQLVEGGQRSEVIALPPGFDERRGELTVQLDPSLAAGMRDGLSYLEHFPYECAEQTVSRFLPNVLTYDALKSLGIENKELSARLPGLVEEGLNKLYTQQNPDGGWGWWATNESNVQVSAYVVFALTKAQQAGIEVSATALANGQNYLTGQLTPAGGIARLNTYEANRQAWVQYVLAEGGIAQRAGLEELFAAREKLAHYARAYLALALNLTDAAKYSANIKTLLSDINNQAILSATGAHWEESGYDYWAMNTDTRSTAIILDALARLDPNNELNPNVVRWLMVARKDGIWETTQETAWALISLTDWMQATGELNANYDYSATLNEAELTSGSATPENVGQSVKLSVPLADLLVDTGNLLTVARTDGNGRLYYSAHLKVYLPVEQLEPAERGIIVSRRYTLASCLAEQATDKTVVCNEVREAKLGDVIRVDLTIIAPNDLYYVVVEDPLPAGAEAIDTGLATTSMLAMDPNLTRTSPAFYGADGESVYPYFWWWNWYSRTEMRDEKVVLFADYLPKGTYEYSYTMRATLPGDYHVIPTVASEFYFPEVFGRSDGRLLSIGR